MTLEERRNPELIDGSRRLRIANGSGVTTSEVNALLKQFSEMQKMMKGFGGRCSAAREEGQEGQEGRPGHPEGRAAAAAPPQRPARARSSSRA